jgi:phage shock protein PspC (stress-responsive transcriptional regulator)
MPSMPPFDDRSLPPHHVFMPTRRLTRSETDKVIAGVCGGLAEYFDIDPTIVRVAAVILALMGAGLLAYIVLWIAVPKASSVPSQPSGSGPGSGGGANALRIAEERYARGEISAEELSRIRRDLAGS